MSALVCTQSVLAAAPCEASPRDTLPLSRGLRTEPGLLLNQTQPAEASSPACQP